MDFTEAIATDYRSVREVVDENDYLRGRVRKLEEENENLGGALVIANSKLAQIGQIAR